MAHRAAWSRHIALPLPDSQTSLPLRRDLISRQRLQRILGAIWLLDGLLQLQPSMFASNLTNGIMQPVTQGQPRLVAASLQAIIHFTGQYLVPVNAAIALLQLALGIFLLGGWFVRPALLISVVWSLGVWYGGEGLGMLLTGQASVLTGAPGPVLLYALLGLGAYPTRTSRGGNLLSRRHLRWLLAGFWALAAVLQMQPVWWQPHQIAQTIAGSESRGTLNGAILDPSLRWLAHLTSTGEIPLNVSIVIIVLGLAIGLAVAGAEHMRPLLAGSIVLSLLLWYATEGCGQLLTGTATDANSGPLLVLLALVCWPPKLARVPAGHRRYWQDEIVHRICVRRQEAAS